MVDDSEFYQQLLVEFLETSNPDGLDKFILTQHFFLLLEYILQYSLNICCDWDIYFLHVREPRVLNSS